MRPLTGFALGPILPPSADLSSSRAAPPDEATLPESLEAARVMSEPEQRPGQGPRPLTPAPAGGFDEDEPPSRPRRHHLWQHIPDHHWDDWRWQSQNAIRSVRQLRDLLPFTDAELEAIGALEGEYKLAIPPYYFSLIDP